MKGYGRVWWLVAVLVAALGLVEGLLAVSSLVAWTAALAAASMGILVHLARLAHREVKALVRHALLVGLVGALIGAGTAGLAAVVGGGPAVVLVGLLACCHPSVVLAVRGTGQRACGWLRHEGSSPPPNPPVPPPNPPVPPANEAPGPPAVQRWPEAAAVRLLSTADLCWGWRTSFTALARTSTRTDLQRFLVLVAVRQRYLDEIARRDPAGFVRWLQAGARPAGDPSRYLSASPDEGRVGPAAGAGDA